MTPAIHKDTLIKTLEENIIFGRLKPRERIVEQDIMDTFQVRRHVIRDALKVLETKGLVQCRPNRGAVVRDLSKREIDELYFMRELLHRSAAELTPLPLCSDTVAQLKQIQSHHDNAIAEHDFSQAYRHNKDFHDTLDSACGNTVLKESLDVYNQRTNLVRSYAFSSLERLQQSAQEHHAIIDACARGDRDAFIRLSLHHVLKIKNIYLDAQLLT